MISVLTKLRVKTATMPLLVLVLIARVAVGEPTNAVPGRASIEELRAAANSNPKAQYELGKAYATGRGVPVNYKEAVAWFKKAADKDADAQYSLGFCYATGAGVSKSMGKAVSWYRKAAEQGHVEAQFKLAVCYDKGLDVARKPSEAMKWYQRAADGGLAEAQLVVGNSLGTEDYNEAFRWFSKAAVRGLAPAQFKLAICYRNGQGVQQDLVEAYKWFLIAADNGSEPAMELAAELRTMTSWGMTTNQIAQGEQKARDAQMQFRQQGL